MLGGADTLLNHEVIARLPRRPESQRELALHSLREAIYGTLFVGLAWAEWHGTLAFAIVALLAIEVAVTASDEFIENRTRLLPQNERVMHVFLTVNLGAIIAVLVPVVARWAGEATGFARADFGWISWALTLLAAASYGWCIRDFAAWRRFAAANRGAPAA